MFPLAFGIIRDEFPRERVPTGIALLGAIAAMGTGIGLPLGGLLADGPGYHWIFWSAAIMGVAATLATHFFVPESPIRTPGRVDFAGAGILTAGLSALLVGISRGGDWGWAAPSTVGVIALGLGTLVAFGLFERRPCDPLINMPTFARRPVLTTNVSTILIGSTMVSTMILVPQLAQLPSGGEVGFGLSTTEGGLLLVPASLISLLVAPIVGRIGERRGSKLPFLAGCVVTSSGLALLAFAHGSVVEVVLGCCLMAAGAGATLAAVPNLVIVAVDPRETGEAIGTNTVMRNIGSAIGAQLAGSVIAGHVLANGLPSDEGFTIAFLIGAVGAGVAAVAVLFIPGSVHRSPRAGTASEMA